MKVEMPPMTRVRRIKVGPWVYRSERFPSGNTLRWITKDARFVWRNDW